MKRGREEAHVGQDDGDIVGYDDDTYLCGPSSVLIVTSTAPCGNACHLLEHEC